MELSRVNTARLAVTAGLCAALIGGGLSAPAVAFAVPNSDYQEVSVALDENTLDDAFAVTSDDRALAASPNDGGSGEDANTGVEDAVAQVGDVTYSSLPDALAAACESSGTVTLLKSVELSAPLEITQGSATIDLAGFTIKPAAETINYPLSVKAGASLGIKDSSAGKTGQVLGGKQGVALVMGGLNLESGSLFSTSTYGVFLTGDKPSMTMTGGSVRAAVEGIRGQFGASIYE